MMMVGSAVSYPYGILDPIPALAKVARKHGIWFHVDACIGDFVLAFARRACRKIPHWDFQVSGVHSISIDLHKYAYAAKGASVILYKNNKLRRYQFFVTTDWPGGIYASPSLLGTRPGGAIAAAWAILHYFGRDGY